MQEQIRAAIHHHIVSTWLSGDERGFDDDTDLLAAGILDSFSTVSIAAFLAESFQVQLEPAEINPASFHNVNTITAIVLGKLATRGGGPALT
jgi:acyl carrier protein